MTSSPQNLSPLIFSQLDGYTGSMIYNFMTKFKPLMSSLLIIRGAIYLNCFWPKQVFIRRSRNSPS